MKKLPVLKELAFFGTILLIVFAYSFTLPKDHSSKDNINNISADDFPSVIIGSQEWMTENLNVDKFRNGDPIPEAKTKEEWIEAGRYGRPAWCYYDNDPENGKIYGKLYNWYAVNDKRGLAPDGWHIPSDEEWTALTDYLGGKDIAGGKMKSTEYWESPNEGATNESGFSGLPGGFRGRDGNFSFIGISGGWWSSTMDRANPDELFLTDKGLRQTLPPWKYWLANTNGSVSRNDVDGNFGLSVRCLRD